MPPMHSQPFPASLGTPRLHPQLPPALQLPPTEQIFGQAGAGAELSAALPVLTGIFTGGSARTLPEGEQGKDEPALWEELRGLSIQHSGTIEVPQGITQCCWLPCLVLPFPRTVNRDNIWPSGLRHFSVFSSGRTMLI